MSSVIPSFSRHTCFQYFPRKNIRGNILSTNLISLPSSREILRNDRKKMMIPKGNRWFFLFLRWIIFWNYQSFSWALTTKNLPLAARSSYSKPHRTAALECLEVPLGRTGTCQKATSTGSCQRQSTTALLTTPIFHMGHSHAHHHHDHHHNHKDEVNQDSLSPAQRKQRWSRRIAMWIFCALATLGPKSIANPRIPIQRADWMTFIISVAALSSTDTLRRNLVLYWQKIRGFGNAIAKHSSSSSPSSSATTTSSTSGLTMKNLFSKSTSPSSSKSNVLYALKTINDDIRDTSDADRVTWIGVVINIILSVGKFLIGIQQNSS